MTRTDPVRSPTVLQCCTAAAGFARGLVRPQRVDCEASRTLGNECAPSRTLGDTLD